MVDYARLFSLRRTPQSEPIPGTVANSAGGHAFPVDDWIRFDRFLVLGAEGGSYYAAERPLTRDNAAAVLRCIAADGARAVARIVAISESGRAPKNDPALFALALAMAAGDEATRSAAGAALPRVARTGTHLFRFAEAVQGQRGWGRGLRRAVARWYLTQPVDDLAYQAVKYRQREGWSHRDLLRLAHPATADDACRALFDYVVRGTVGGPLPAIVEDFTDAQGATTPSQWVQIVERGRGLSWEMLPDEALGHREVWEALLARGIPPTALMRQLPRLTRLGLADGVTGAVIAAQLADSERLKRARVHPISVLVAQRTYAAGRSARGSGTWTPSSTISDALDAAFYNAYGAVEPSGKRTLLALDVSGSMVARVSGMPLSCREAAAALAMVTAATESDPMVVGFTGEHRRKDQRIILERNTITELDISPRRRLDDICRYTAELPMGWTDCALPFVWASEQSKVFDTVVILTDSESFAGPIHVHQALRRYRETVNPRARLVVVSMTATGNTVGDPADPLSLDVAGFDTTVPQVIADFSRGDT